MKSKEDQPFFAAVGMCPISALLLAECGRVRNKGTHTFGNVVSDGILYKTHIKLLMVLVVMSSTRIKPKVPMHSLSYPFFLSQ
jgi:hypothetical protein